MDTAYDLNALTEKLKARGLDLAEDGAKAVLEEVCNWLDESAHLSETPYDNMAVVILPQLKALALAQIDKIDGQPG